MKVKHVLMIAAVLLAMFVAPVVAADPQSVVISADVTESYEFSIPQGLNFNPVEAGATLTGTVSVVVKSLDPEAAVSITVDSGNNWYLNHEKSETGYCLQYDMKKDDGTPIADEGVVISTPYTADQDVIFTLLETPIKSGEYTDTLTFTAEMVEANYDEQIVDTVQKLQSAIDAATGETTIVLGADITGDVTVTQKENVKITIDGAGKKYDGAIIVDGQSQRYDTAALTIRNVNFESNSIDDPAFICLGISGNNDARYTNHVTVEDCSFAYSGSRTEVVAVKSFTGGDKNLILDGCTILADGNMFSLLNVANVEEGLKVINCNVAGLLEGGLNLNNCPGLEMSGCTISGKMYAVRFGVGDTGFATNSDEKFFSITDSTLQSTDTDPTDAVIIFRDNAKYSTLTLTDTTLTGTTAINGNTAETTIIWAVDSADELATAAANGATEVILADGEYDVYGCGGETLTISGTKDAVLKLKNEGEDGCDYAFGGNGAGVGDITFNGITIDTTENTGNYKGFAYMKGTFNDCNFVGAYSLNNANDFVFNGCTFDFKNGYFWTWGANSVTFEKCTFNGNSKAILAHGYASTAITISDCTFAATEEGYTGSGDNTAAVEIDPAGANTYTILFTGTNTKTEFYSGWTRVKDDSTGHTITGVST